MNRIFSLIIFLLFIFNTSYAQNYKPLENREAFLKIYKEKAKATASLTSDFTQMKTISMLEKKLISEGRFCYKSPSKVRMEYIKPFAFLFILNNDRVIIRSNQKETTIPTSSNKIFKIISQITVDCVSGDVFDNKNFKSSILESNTQYEVTLIPTFKELESILKEIKVIVSKKDYTVDRIEMSEVSGDFTQIVFKNKEINPSVPDATFTGN